MDTIKRVLTYILGGIILFIVYLPALPLAYIYAVHYAAKIITKSTRLFNNE